ncbi:Iron-sulfur cluster-binding protein [hydrothermal vent metagenome]|uniref:Iron-sulfur cluster-binding protein n=1 Tax=hydrothermal vent metagenome TaxID=652676 RepID=A0A1W1EFY4_9ZZZZ
MQEFVYYNSTPLDFPLPETIKVTSDPSQILNNDFIVSNSASVEAEVTAQEINFYMRNTKDAISEQIKNIEKLYEINAIRFDLSQDMPYEQEVDNRVLLVASEEQEKEFAEKMIADEFDLYVVRPELVIAIDGHIGALEVTIVSNNKEVPVNVSQIVWFDHDEIAVEQSGSFDPVESSVEDVLSILRKNIAHYSFRKMTVYDKTICQYHERREEICSKCEEVCPTVAIVKHDETKTLEFSQIDCHGCGGCISVCPSGALDYAPSNRDSISEISKEIRGHIPLIIPRNMNIENLNIELKENVLPLAVEGEKFLHEGTFLTLAQESGSQIVFYSDFISKGSRDSIDILNQIYQKKYGVDAVIIAMNETELKEALEVVNFVENSRYTFNESGAKKREIFAIRLRNIVGEDDLGVVTTGEHVHYGRVRVNEDKCTLCLVCVGACNVDALIANTEDNTLRINSSVCTMCGYCEVSCPEADCLDIVKDVIELKPSWFKEEVLAKDTLFECVECGKPFATTKAISKIAEMMAPIFAVDPIKERTLYCCADCKPKIMMESYAANRDQYNNPTVEGR